jgi:hypothetical protein
MLEQGRRIFRFDTFGSGPSWGDTLQLHQAIAGEEWRRGRTGVSPKPPSPSASLDADALLEALEADQGRKVDLDDPRRRSHCSSSMPSSASPVSST